MSKKQKSQTKSKKERDLEKEIKELFNSFDKDKSRAITCDELGRAMRFLGLTVTKRDVDEAMRVLDVDGNGQIEYKEFLKYMKKVVPTNPTKEEEEAALRSAFGLFDRDGNGYIDERELKYVMKNLGEKLTDSEVKDMMKHADVDGDGRINYEEFCKMWTESFTD